MQMEEEALPPEGPRTIYGSAHYRVVQMDFQESDRVFILFTTWRADQHLDQPVFGEAFLTRRRMSYIAVRSAFNDWFQGPIEPAITQVKAAVCGRRAIGYGSSMGAYAALNFAPDLGLERSVCFVPQFSIDARKAPFETRWRSEAACLDFHSDGISDHAGHQATIVYDPLHQRDAQHVELIAQTHRVRRVEIPAAGHDVAEALKVAKIIGRVTTELLASVPPTEDELRILFAPVQTQGPA